MSKFLKELDFPLKKKTSFSDNADLINRPRKISHQPQPMTPRFMIEDPESESELRLTNPPLLLTKSNSSDVSYSTTENGNSKFTFNQIMSISSALSNEESQQSEKMEFSDYLNKKVNELKRRATVSTVQDLSNSDQKFRKRGLNISDFKIIKFLGKANYWFCLRDQNDRQKKVTEMKSEQNIIRQLKIQIRINHPNIARSYGFFADVDNIYIIQQFAGQRTLHSVLKSKGTIQQKKVQNIIKQIAKATFYLHNFDILHRDLKLENIVIHQGIAKVCDFGCAVQSSIPRRTFIGSIPYLSPEQVIYQKYGKKKDIWSIGIIAHEILFGYSPFEQEIAQNLQYPIAQRRFPKLNIEKLKEKNKKGAQFLVDILQQNQIIRMTAEEVLNHPFLNQ